MSDLLEWAMEASFVFAFTLVYMVFVAYHAPPIIDDMSSSPVAQTLFVSLLMIAGVGIPLSSVDTMMEDSDHE